MVDKNSLTVVFICGVAHSGSTLLGMMLGSHPDVFYLGEGNKLKYLNDSSAPHHKRICKVCGGECEFWKDFSFKPDGNFYADVAERAGKRIVVDSTKRIEWLREQYRKLGGFALRGKLIFLARDGRATVNSIMRKKTHLSCGQAIAYWMERMAMAREFFEGFGFERIMVRYEELASAPEKVISRLCGFLGIGYDPEMLRYYAHPGHPLGGNSGVQYKAMSFAREKTGIPLPELPAYRRYYLDSPADVHIDRRWVGELSEEAKSLFERLAGSMNADFRWDY